MTAEESKQQLMTAMAQIEKILTEHNLMGAFVVGNEQHTVQAITMAKDYNFFACHPETKQIGVLIPNGEYSRPKLDATLAQCVNMKNNALSVVQYLNFVEQNARNVLGMKEDRDAFTNNQN